jgi:phage tail-like protein
VSDSEKSNFVNLNAGGRWPGFAWDGLELLQDGVLQLQSLPLIEGDLSEAVSGLPVPDGPAGVAIDKEGSIYYSDPTGNRILVIDACTGSTAPLPCIGGLDKPRGLAIPTHRGTLFVADSGNDRVAGFDLQSFQLIELLGEADQGAIHQSAFDTPWDIAGDVDGNLYVVDYGNKRVQKFNRAGVLVPGFWEAVRNSSVEQPACIAAYSNAGETTVYVLDLASRSIFAFDEDGQPRLDKGGVPIQFGSPWLRQPMGLAASRGYVYVGDNERRRVLTFVTRGFRFAGEAVGYDGPVAGLAIDHRGVLLVHGGSALAPVRLNPVLGHVARGILWSSAIKVREFAVWWHRVQAVTETTGSRALLRLFVHASDDQADAPSVDIGGADPFADPGWRPASSSIPLLTNLDDVFVGGAPAEYIWIGAQLAGDGRSTPLLSQIRVEFNHKTYLEHLPAIYSNDSACGEFLRRFVSLFETFFQGVEGEIADLSALFDPAIVPRLFLPWLAGWLALELDEEWDEQMQRQMIARAFEMYGRRGTREGLREALRMFAGVDAIIEEPLLNAEWWALPSPEKTCRCEQPCEGACGCQGRCGCSTRSAGSRESIWVATGNSILGVTTMLAPAHPQGSVLGTTSTLDRSHLITDEEFGMPLFEDVAHQFTVKVYKGQLACPEKIEEVRRVIGREKPAHTAYHLCVIEPGARVEYRAAVGIDAVVGGPTEPFPLGEASALGRDALLGGALPGRLGVENRVGRTTRVG